MLHRGGEARYICSVMAQARVSSSSWLHTRICPRCGYDGQELQAGRGDEQYECPSCGEDLYARPAMSYAQMEGITPVALVHLTDRGGRGVSQREPVGRWRGLGEWGGWGGWASVRAWASRFRRRVLSAMRCAS